MRASYPQRPGSGRCPAHREVDCAVPLSGPLRALDGQPQGLSLSQLSQRISLPRSTVHRLVNALEHEGFVAAASPNGRVRPMPTQRFAGREGPIVAALAAARAEAVAVLGARA
jgi:hypothetical protein